MGSSKTIWKAGCREEKHLNVEIWDSLMEKWGQDHVVKPSWGCCPGEGFGSMAKSTSWAAKEHCPALPVGRGILWIRTNKLLEFQSWACQGVHILVTPSKSILFNAWLAVLITPWEGLHCQDNHNLPMVQYFPSSSISYLSPGSLSAIKDSKFGSLWKALIVHDLTVFGLFCPIHVWSTDRPFLDTTC